MLILRATARLRQRLGRSTLGDEQPTTLLGQWYATELRWRPCSPLYKRHVSPDRELAALLAPTRR